MSWLVKDSKIKIKIGSNNLSKILSSLSHSLPSSFHSLSFPSGHGSPSPLARSFRCSSTLLPLSLGLPPSTRSRLAHWLCALRPLAAVDGAPPPPRAPSPATALYLSHLLVVVKEQRARPSPPVPVAQASMRKKATGLARPSKATLRSSTFSSAVSAVEERRE